MPPLYSGPHFSYTFNMKPMSRKTAYPEIPGKLLSIAVSIILSACLLSISIALPILCRDFYYLQIKRLDLPSQTGYSEETIRQAYDDVLDYCTQGGETAGLTFHTGKLAWSESGKEHFDDVQRLFHLDFVIAILSGALLAGLCIINVILFLRRGRRLSFYRFLNRGPLFWGPVCMLLIAALDFDGFFTGFHHVLFPGKDTWLLDMDTDQIIRILPYEVLGNFGLAILGLLAIGCAGCIAADLLIGKRSRGCPRRGGRS